MKIPKKLKIAGLIWNVKKDKNVTHEGDCYGTTHHTNQNIFISTETTQQKNEETLIHEILHAVWHAYGLGEDKVLKDYDERIVRSLGTGLYQVLNDNKMLK